MHKVITMTDSRYFQYGEKFIQTRKQIDAEFICYAPDLTDNQIKVLCDNHITYKPIDQTLFNQQMQTLKFQFLINEMNIGCGLYGLTFCDFDTYFLKDWQNVFSVDFDFGITVRTEFYNNKVTPRAYANGGVIFAQNSAYSRNLCRLALSTIKVGKSDVLPEYDVIWKTLEEGRKPHKTHHRTDLRWWCDQVFLSALLMHLDNNRGKNTEIKGVYKISLFDCKEYNNMYYNTGYIVHQKQAPAELKDRKCA